MVIFPISYVIVFHTYAYGNRDTYEISQESRPKEPNGARKDGALSKSSQQGTTTPTILEGGHRFKKSEDLDKYALDGGLHIVLQIMDWQ